MKQYQIVTLLVICLTVLTVYQLQKGLLKKTHDFVESSLNELPQPEALLPIISDTKTPSVPEEQLLEIYMVEKDVKKSFEVKSCQGKIRQMKILDGEI